MFSKKIHPNPRICGLRILFSGQITHLIENIDANLETFFSSQIINAEFEDSYFGKGSFSFSERGSDSDPGISYQHQVFFQFPSNDHRRAQRLHRLTQLIGIELLLTNGSSMFVGRNDHTQNAAPTISLRSDLGITQITVSAWSETPLSFVETQSAAAQFYGSNFGEGVYS